MKHTGYVQSLSKKQRYVEKKVSYKFYYCTSDSWCNSLSTFSVLLQLRWLYLKLIWWQFGNRVLLLLLQVFWCVLSCETINHLRRNHAYSAILCDRVVFMRNIPSMMEHSGVHPTGKCDQWKKWIFVSTLQRLCVVAILPVNGNTFIITYWQWVLLKLFFWPINWLANIFRKKKRIFFFIAVKTSYWSLCSRLSYSLSVHLLCGKKSARCVSCWEHWYSLRVK